MQLRDLLPTSEHLTHAEGVERDLLRRRRSGALTGFTALTAATAQVVFALVQREDYLQNIGNATRALLRLDLGQLLTRPEGVGLVVIVTATAGWLLLRRTSFLMQESREPFRYTFWIDPFKAVQDAKPHGIAIENEERLQLLHLDLIERLNQRIARRFSLLDVTRLSENACAQLTSHARISGTYAIRDRGEERLIVHVMPRLGIGPAVGPEVVADPVNYPITADEGARNDQGATKLDLSSDRYIQLVERVYSSVASKIYEQIRTDVRDKMRLFPTGYLKAVAYLHEAQDFERSNTLDAYDHAIELYRQAKRYFEVNKIGWLTRFIGRLPFVWRVDRRFLLMEARTRIGYARCLVYRRLISALSGRPRNALFEVHGELQQARDELESLFNHAEATGWFPIRTSSNQRESAFTAQLAEEEDQAGNRYRAFLASLAVRNDSLLRRSSERFEETRRTLFEAYAVSALAHSQLDGIQQAATFLELAAAIDPAAGQDHPLWLLAAAEIEPELQQKQLLLRRATDIAPAFEIAHYRHAWVAEMQLRAQNDLSTERVKSVIEEYEKVLGVNPGNVGAHAAQGYLCWLVNDLPRARKHYEAGCDIKATVTQTFVGDLNYGLARVAAESAAARKDGNPQDDTAREIDAVKINRSYTLYASALSADPGVGAYTTTSGTRGMHLSFDYISPVMVARYRKFRRTVRQYAQRGERTPDVSKRVVHALYAHALNDYGSALLNSYLRSGDWRKLRIAVCAYERATEFDDQNAVARYNLYVAYNWRQDPGDVEKAQLCLERVAEALPTWTPALTALSQHLVRKARTQLDETERELERKQREAKEAAVEAARLQPQVQSVVTASTLKAETPPSYKADMASSPLEPRAATEGSDESKASKKLAGEMPRVIPRTAPPGLTPTWVASQSQQSGPLLDQLSKAAAAARDNQATKQQEAEEASAEAKRRQQRVAKLVSDARAMMRRDVRFAPLFTDYTETDRGGIAALLRNGLLSWERVDDALVQTLRAWAAISSESANVQEAELLCRFILARYYPDDFDTILALQNALERRRDDIRNRKESEQKEKEIQDELERCRTRLKLLIDYWVKQDPISYVTMLWHGSFFDAEARLRVLKRASALDASPRFRRVLAEFFAEPARTAVDTRTAIENYERAIELCLEHGGYYAGLAEARERSSEAGKRIATLDAALDAWQNAEQRGYAIDHDNVRSLRTARAVAQHAGEAALDRLPVVTPIAVEVASNLVPIIGTESGGLQDELSERVVNMRDSIRKELGVYVPGVRFRGNEGDLPPGSHIIMLSETPLLMGHIDLEQRLFPGPLKTLRGIGVEGNWAANPQDDSPAAWVVREHWGTVENAQLSLWTPAQYLINHLDAFLRNNLLEFVGYQEVVLLVKDLPDPPERQELSDFVAVLRALVSEGATIAPLYEILAEFRRLHEQSHSLLKMVESIRQLPAVRLKLPGNHDRYDFLRLSADFEAELARWLHRTGSIAVLAIEPSACQEALAAIRNRIEDLPAASMTALLVRDSELRPFVRKLIELEWPRTPVLAEAELRQRLHSRIIGEIALGKA